MKTSRLSACWALPSIAAFALVGCNSAKVEHSWKAPGLQRLEFNKVLVLSSSTDGATRRLVEETVKECIPDVTIIPGYTAIPDATSVSDILLVREAALRSGADGVVILRLIANRNELSYSVDESYPKSNYTTLGGYWGARAFVFSGPKAFADHIVVIETNIYDVKTEKLVWSGTTESYNPGKLAELVTDVSKAVLAELRRQKLITPN